MNKKHYCTPTLGVELDETDVICTSFSLTDKDVVENDIYGDEIWG